MNLIHITIYVTVLFGLSAISTYGFLRHAHKVGLIDYPNARSSHSTPTPRGGGIVFSTLSMIAWCVLAYLNVVPIMQAILVTLPCSLIIGIGYLDDRLQLGKGVRLAVQIFAAALLLFLASNEGNIYTSSIIASLATGGCIVWLTNLYNFMDGIDCMAALYGITITLITTFLAYNAGNHAAAVLALTISTSLIGFMFFNWPPAKLFMGDAGSTFLGFSTAVLILITPLQINWIDWAILLACFVGDTTWTLIYRILTRQKWAQPHRSHAYQKMAYKPELHKKVSILYSLYTACWLFPLINLRQHFMIDATTSLLLAYAPVIVLCAAVSAGTQKHTDN